MNENPNTAEKKEALAAEELPVLVPDDYDPDEVDYTEQRARRAAAMANTEEYTPYKPKKLKGKEAVENFFYHHKTKVIIILVAAVLLAAVYFTSIPTKYDYTFIIYADLGLGIDGLDEIQKQMTEYCDDIDGNGVVNVNILVYNRDSAEVYESIAAMMYMGTDLRNQNTAFLIINDEKHYDYICADHGTEVFETQADSPYGISLKDSELITPTAEYFGNENELYLNLLTVPEKEADNAEVIAAHDNAAAVLERIIKANPELAA